MTLTKEQLAEIVERGRCEECANPWINDEELGALLSHIATLEQRERLAVKALRAGVIYSIAQAQDGSKLMCCYQCSEHQKLGNTISEPLPPGFWFSDQPERHNPVTLPGDTSPGPCPAELAKE